MTDTANYASSDLELISFGISGQQFCLDVKAIREIRGWTPTTAVPEAPHYVRGLINLRGTVLAVIDLGVRLGFPPSEPTARHAIIVTDIGDQTVGLLVDGVSDIFRFPPNEVQPTPEVASAMATSFIKGIMDHEGQLISFIAIEKLLPESSRLAA